MAGDFLSDDPVSTKMCDRVAIVTGATSGIGFASATLLLRNGAIVVGSGRQSRPMEDLQRTAELCHTRFLPVLGDVTEAEAADRLVDSARRATGRSVDLAVICAGRGLPGTLLTSDERRWEELFKVNTLTVMKQLKRFASVMIEDCALEPRLARARDIVVIGSTIGRVVSPFNPVYGATKFAVHAATEALRREVCGLGIRVTLIEPGIVETAFQESAGYDRNWFNSYSEEIGPLLHAADVAEAVIFATTRPAHVHLNDIVIRPTRQPIP